MAYELVKSFAYFMIALAIVTPSFIVFDIGYEIHKVKAPCVDGDGDKNLAGIMCEKTEYTLFGEETDSATIFLIMLFLFLSSLVTFILLIIVFITASLPEQE